MLFQSEKIVVLLFCKNAKTLDKAKYILSRSTFSKGLQCTKQLFLLKNQIERQQSPMTDEQKAIKKRSNYLRELAQKLYPKGEDGQLGCNSYEESAERTQKFISLKQKVIYNAVFIEKEIAVVIDVLVWKRGAWKAYEVKAGTKVTKGSILFAAFKWYVLKHSTMRVNDFSFIILNKDYYRGEKLHFMQCFKRVSKFHDIKKMGIFVGKKTQEFKDILAQDQVPEVAIGKHCITPYDCRVKDQCWGKTPNDSVFDIVGLSNDYKFQLYNEGLTQMKDVLSLKTTEINENQKMQIKGAVTGENAIQKNDLTAFLGQIQYPVHYLDFESYQPFLPRERGMSPLQQCVFQYSLHQQKRMGGDLIHQEFLMTPNQEGDIRQLFLESLLTQTKEAKSILVYDVSFEKYYLQYLAKTFPKYRKRIESLMEKMIDLMQPFSQKWVYTPEMKGLHSIKSVLPALVPNMDYKDLNLQNGLMASLAYAQWSEGTYTGDIEELEKNLRAYCELDTFAMTQILDVLYKYVQS